MRQTCLLVVLVLLGACSTSHYMKIAHRGASGYLPEHTLEGAALAHSWDIDFIEPDLVLTKDDHFVVLHDHHLDTTTDVAKKFPRRKRQDGRYYAIDFTLTEIKSLNVYERFDHKTGKPVFPARFKAGASGFQVPTYHEFVTLINELNRTRLKLVGVYPELKKPEFHLKEGKDITAAFVREIERSASERIIVQSFWPETLKRLRHEFKRSEFLVQLVANNSWGESSADYDKMLSDAGLIEVSKYADAVGVSFGHIMQDETLVKRAHRAKLKVHVYTHRLDQKYGDLTAGEVLKKARELGVDGVFSDFADQL